MKKHPSIMPYPNRDLHMEFKIMKKVLTPEMEA